MSRYDQSGNLLVSHVYGRAVVLQFLVEIDCYNSVQQGLQSLLEDALSAPITSTQTFYLDFYEDFEHTRENLSQKLLLERWSICFQPQSARFSIWQNEKAKDEVYHGPKEELGSQFIDLVIDELPGEKPEVVELQDLEEAVPMSSEHFSDDGTSATSRENLAVALLLRSVYCHMRLLPARKKVWVRKGGQEAESLLYQAYRGPTVSSRRSFLGKCSGTCTAYILSSTVCLQFVSGPVGMLIRECETNCT